MSSFLGLWALKTGAIAFSSAKVLVAGELDCLDVQFTEGRPVCMGHQDYCVVHVGIGTAVSYHESVEYSMPWLGEWVLDAMFYLKIILI